MDKGNLKQVEQPRRFYTFYHNTAFKSKRRRLWCHTFGNNDIQVSYRDSDILSIYCPALFQMIFQNKFMDPYSICADKPLYFLHTGRLW